MFDSYQDIFEVRGQLYDKAMRLYPLAREQEFNPIVAVADLQEGYVICDIPSGGGYLRNFVKTKVKIVSIEPSPVFAKLLPGAEKV